jgi:hypothetical protein
MKDWEVFSGIGVIEGDRIVSWVDIGRQENRNATQIAGNIL